MPRVIHEGVAHDFPASFTAADIAAALASLPQKKPATPAAQTAMAGFADVANVKTEPTLVPGMPVTPSWPGVTGFVESPEQRRQAAKGQLAIYSNEAKSAPNDAALMATIARTGLVATAENPFRTELAINPKSAYRKLLKP